MQEKVITLATPIFFVLIFIELIVGLKRRRNTYRLNDAINSLSFGVLSQVSSVFMRLLRISIYAWLFKHFALFSLLATAAGVTLSGAWFGIAALPSFAAVAVSMLAGGSLLALWFVFRHSDDAYGYLSRHEHSSHSTE